MNNELNTDAHLLQTTVTGSAVFHGDCLEVMKNIPDRSVDMILADLPYGTTQCKWDSVIDLEKLWSQYDRIIKDNGAIVLTAQTPFDKVLGASNLKLLKYEWIWEKTSATGHLNAKKMPMKAHENVLVFYKNPPIYNYQKTEGHERKVSKAEHKINCKESDVYNKGQKLTTYDSTERYPRSVLKFASDKQKSKLHPTQKPLALMEYFVKTYSNEGDVILDNTAGSGTTAIACINTNRNYILIEKEKNYIDIINERINKCKMEKWIKTTDQRPKIGTNVEYSEDGETVEGTLIYTDRRTCMMAGIAGGYGYFGEGFATDGNDCDYGLKCDDPEYWREI